MGPEAKIQTKVLKWLASQGAYNAKIIKASKSGVPDIVACVPLVITKDMVGKTLGVFAGLEVKSAVGVATDLQKYHLESISRAGGLGGVVRSVDDAKSLLSFGLWPGKG
jgi:hypothetical protein